MQKISIISTILLSSLTYNLHAQEPNETEKNEKSPKYEISFDMFGLVSSPTANLSLSFDYLLNESESIGITSRFKSFDLFDSIHNEFSIGGEYKHFKKKICTRLLYKCWFKL